MFETNNDLPTGLLEGSVMLPWPGAWLQVQARNREIIPPPVTPKCRLRVVDDAHRKLLAGALGQGARMARTVEPLHGARVPNVELLLSAEDGSSAVAADDVPGIMAWAAAAGALSDRVARRMARTWARSTVLLAGIDLGEPDPLRWGLLQPLAPALEHAALQVLRDGPVGAALQDALIVLPDDEPRYAPLRAELSARWPKAKVCLAGSLDALTRVAGMPSKPRMGEVWYPLVWTDGAGLRCIRVVVAPDLTGGTRPLVSVEVTFTPVAHGAADAQRWASSLGARLDAWRSQESPAAPQRWKTLLQLPADLPTASGSSYELALFLADRMARGREWAGQGRVFATGGIDTMDQDRCRVTSVAATVAPAQATNEQAPNKLDLLFAEAVAGDSILLPDDADWRNAVVARLGALRDDDTAETGAGALVMFVRQVLP